MGCIWLCRCEASCECIWLTTHVALYSLLLSFHVSWHGLNRTSLAAVHNHCPGKLRVHMVLSLRGKLRVYMVDDACCIVQFVVIIPCELAWSQPHKFGSYPQPLARQVASVYGGRRTLHCTVCCYHSM